MVAIIPGHRTDSPPVGLTAAGAPEYSREPFCAGHLEGDMTDRRDAASTPAWTAPAPHHGDPLPAPAPGDLRFPDGFLWGAQTAPTQVEGGGLDNNMIEWAKGDPKRVADGSTPLPGLDHWNRLDADYADLAANGHNAHAFAIDWSRIEPVEGHFDQAAMDHYRREIEISRARGMEPIITLLHYAIPNWLVAKGGILNDQAPELFERFSRHVVEQVGDQVTWWNTLNEPNALAGMSYMEGAWPPGEKNVIHFFQAMGATLKLHAAGARAIRAVSAEHGREARISIAHNLRPIHPKQAHNPLDIVAAAVPDYIINRWFLNSVKAGRPKLGIGGSFLGLGDFKKIDGLKDSFDWVGLNYYTRNYMHVALPFLDNKKPKAAGTRRIKLKSAVAMTASVRPAESKSPLPSGILQMTPIRGEPQTTYPEDTTFDPDGLYEAAANVWGQFRKPIIITESGVPDTTTRAADGTLVDALRPRFLIDHAAVMRHLIDDGVPVIGYMHWTDWDNWEWVAGWQPKFGLFSFDPKTGLREAKYGASIFKTLAERNAVPESWLTAENRQSPVDRDPFSRGAALDAGIGSVRQSGLRRLHLPGRALRGVTPPQAPAPAAIPERVDLGL
jgi:beta-glucosidase